MKRTLSVLFFCWICAGTHAQTFTFECFGGYLTTADANCDICNTQVQSRLFNGLLVRRNGVVTAWIDCPYIIRVQGNNLVFQEIIPNPQSITVALVGTGYSTLTGFKDSTACMCARQDSSWIGGGGSGDPSITNEGILGVGAGASNTSVITSNTSTAAGVTIIAAGINTISETTSSNGGTITITGTEVDGSTTNELQTIANTSDATSHTATLSNSGGSIQVIEGTGIGLATGGSGLNGTVTVTNTAPDQTVSITGGGISVVTGTYPNFTVTSTEVDGSVTNEGSLTVGAGGSNTSTIVSNTSGSTPVTVSGSNTILVTESGSTITVQGDTSLLATVNDLNTQRTFVKVATNGDANYNVNAYRNGTTGFRTQDTTGVVDIKVVSLTKPGLYQEGKTGQSVMFTKFAPIGYSGLTGLGSFNITGGYYTGVNEPISSRPNYVYDIGYNLKPGATRENTHEPTLGFGFETFYANAALHASDGFMEGHWRTMDTFGVEHRHVSFVAPWNGKRNRDVFSIASDQFNLLDFGEAPVWAVRPNSNLWSVADSTLIQFTEPRGFGLSVYNGAGSAAMSLMDFNNTDTLEVGRSNLPATRIQNMLIVHQSKIYPRWTDNELQIGSSSSPDRRADLWINQKTSNALRLRGPTRTWAFENAGSTLAISDITAGQIPLYIYTGNSDAAFVFKDNRLGINVPGAAPTQSLHVVGNARVTGAFYDSNNDPGTSGQVLTSTVTGTDWTSAGSAVTGTGVAGQVTYWNGTTTITGSSGWLFDGGSAETLKSTAGDPITKYSITGGSTWTIGTDNSDADRFKLSLGNALGTNDKIYVDTTGKTYVYNTIVVNTQDANVATLGSVPGTANYPGLWFGSATPSLSNYALLADIGAIKTILNAPSSGKISFGISNSEKMRMTSTGLSIQAGADPVNPLDVEGAAVIGATYAGTNTGPTNGLLVEGSIGVGNTSPSQKVHITGSIRVTGGFYDSNNDPGTSGQVLSSTVTGTDWIAAGTGTLTAANNGLYVSGTTVRMGTNPLIEATLIDQDANDMRFYDGKWSYSSRSISWTPTQGMGVQGLEASPTTNSTPTQDGIVEFAVTNSSNSLQSNSLTIGAYATDADGVWIQARSNAVPNVNYPLQVQPRGGKFSVGRVTATLAKATFAAVALPGSTAAGSVVHWESTEGNKKAAATFGVGTDVVDGEIAYFDSLDITRITNRNTATGASSVRIAVGGETSDRVTVVASSVTPSARMGIGTTAPTSTLQSAGSFSRPAITTTAATTLDERHSMVVFTGSTGVTFTLPTASGVSGREYIIAHNGSAGTLTLSTTVTKGNASTFNTLTAGQWAWIKSDGTIWRGFKVASL